jgi:hypothetical protein
MNELKMNQSLDLSSMGLSPLSYDETIIIDGGNGFVKFLEFIGAYDALKDFGEGFIRGAKDGLK